MSQTRVAVGLGKELLYRPYRFCVKVWAHRIDPMPDWVLDDDGEVKFFSAEEADQLVTELKSQGHGADKYVWIGKYHNIFGGAAARADVRVREDGTYVPHLPVGVT